MTFTLDEALVVLREQWGYREFRKSQREAMVCVGEGDDVLAVLPTGTGKSLLYQLPALLSAGGTIVVSPLIALMKDQVNAAKARGIPAACINSNMDDDDQWEALEGFVCGSTKLLYISPERIGVKSFLKAVQRADVSIIAVDEAHCCHPAGTLVRTPTGDVPIETLQVGDFVTAFDGNQPVSRRLLDCASVGINGRGLFRIRFADGRELDLTGDHKIWMEGRGYVEAQDVDIGDEALRSLPDATLSEESPRTGAVLRQDLLRGSAASRNVEAARCSLRDVQASVRTEKQGIRSNGQVLFASVRESGRSVASNPASVSRVRSDIPYSTTQGMQCGVWIRSSRRASVQGAERRRTRGAIAVRTVIGRRAAVLPARSWREAEGVDPYRSRVSRLEGRDRVRRTGTQDGGEGPTRPRTRSQAAASRVVGVETLVEVGDRGRGDRSAGDSVVYSLTVEKDHNYFAAGALVANCSQWGHQFRPDYMHVHRLIRSVSDGETRPQVLAMTATATAIVVSDIVQSLGLDADAVSTLVADPIRHNLRYEVEDGGIDGYGNPWGIFRRIVRNMDVENGRHLAYISSRNGAEKLASMCEEEHAEGIAVAYHAGLNGTKRTAIQEDFSDAHGKARIVTATTAFGMGVDVPNIRTVVLFGFPGSLEDYTQQIGRAGRDGEVARTVLIADQSSADWQMRLIENENPPWEHYQLVWEYLHAQLQPGETLRKKRDDIAQEITALKIVSLSADQIGVILNRLHSAGLIERRAIEEGVPVTVDRPALLRAIEGPGKAKPQIQHVWRTFLENCVEPEFEKQGKKNPLVVWINKTALKDQAGLTAYYVTKALEFLQPRGAVLDVGQAISGVLVKVLRWRADLAEELPVDRIEEKRQRDFARFQRMLEFARLRTEEERKSMLRDYFLRSAEYV